MNAARAYFYCVPSEGRTEVPYQHLLVALAEGLTALGIACYANANYWALDPQRTRYLLAHDPAVSPDDCSLVVVSDDWIVTGEPLPQRSGPACWVALDREDGSRLHSLALEYRAYDHVLRTHYNRHTRYPANFVPWAYGLSERIVAATRAVPAERRWEMLANWRHTRNPHSLRLAVERSLLPRLAEVLPVDTASDDRDAPPVDERERLWWRETGRRHAPRYYARLRGAAACACFGGYFVTRRPAAKESLLSRALKRALTLTRARTHLISQWDSWRFWESLAAGCLSVHVDLERYGCVLPVMPRNGEHYLGIDLKAPDAALAQLREDPGSAARIGAAGRAWALEHYGPAATARRLLDLAGVAYSDESGLYSSGMYVPGTLATTAG